MICTYEDLKDETPIQNSKLLSGICKKVEIETGKYLESKGYPLSRIEPDVMRVLNKETIEEFPDHEEEIRGMIEGFRIAEGLQHRVPLDCPRKDWIFLAMIKAATKLKYRSIDDGIRSLVNLADKNIYEVYVLAGLAAYRETIDPKEVRKKRDEIYKVLGKREQGRKVKRKFKQLIGSLETGGASLEVRELVNKVSEKLENFAPDLKPLPEKDESMVRDILRVVEEEYLDKIKARPGKYVFV